MAVDWTDLEPVQEADAQPEKPATDWSQFEPETDYVQRQILSGQFPKTKRAPQIGTPPPVPTGHYNLPPLTPEEMEEMKKPRTAWAQLGSDIVGAFERGAASGIAGMQRGIEGAGRALPGETQAEKLARTQKAGAWWQKQAEAVEEPSESFYTKAAGAAGGFVPLLLTGGEAAPLVMGAQATGDTMMLSFNEAKKRGLSDEDAAAEAIKKANKAGLVEATIWSVLPAPLRKVLGKGTEMVGEGAIRQFLARRAAAGTEMGVLGATSQAGRNVVTGQPVTQDVAAAGLGGAAIGAGMPFHVEPSLTRQDDLAWQNLQKSDAYKKFIEAQARVGGSPVMQRAELPLTAQATDMMRPPPPPPEAGGFNVGVAKGPSGTPRGPGPTVPGTPAEERTSVPLMITRDMMQQLADLGWTKEQRGAMTPQRANDILKAGERAPEPPTVDVEAEGIRKANAKTLAQVKAIFPKMNNREARAALARAWKGPDASEDEKATEVHGDVRAQSEQGQGQVPEQGGSARVRPEAEGGIQTPQGNVLLNDINRLATSHPSQFGGHVGSAESAERFGSQATTPAELDALKGGEAKAVEEMKGATELGDRLAAQRKRQFFTEAARHATPRVVQAQRGWTFNPEIQYAGMDKKSFESLPPEQQSEMQAAGIGNRSWEFTDRRKGSPTEGISFYVDEGTDYKAVLDTLKTKTDTVLAARSKQVEAEQTSHLANVPIVEAPVSEIAIDNEAVPNFKRGADLETGLVPGQRLQGKFERLGTAPIVVWRMRDGKQVVVTGRHRLDLAKRTGEKTIPVQFVDEAKGFTQKDALNLDAEANIRDGQGEIEDYANYFRRRIAEGYTEQQALEQGLLSRAKGKAGWDLGKDATDDIYAAYRAEKISEAQALAIARAAPGDEAAQRIGLREALNGKSADYVSNVIKAAQSDTGDQPEQLDLLGQDIGRQQRWAEQAKRAGEFQTELRNQISAISGASKKPEVAARLGVDVKDPDAVRAKVAQLRTELQRWESWPMQPDLVAKTRGEEAPREKVLTPNAIRIQTANGLRRVIVRAERNEQTGQYKLGKITVHNDETGSYDIFHPPPSKEFSTPEEAEQAGLQMARQALEVKTAQPKQPDLLTGGGAEPPKAASPEGKPLFTTNEQKRVDELMKKLRDKLGGSYANPFFDPELYAIGGELAFHFIKAGVRRFGDFAKQMIEALGGRAKPHLLAWYAKARMQLPDIAHELDTEDAAKQVAAEHFGIGPATGHEVPGRVRAGGGGRGRPGIRVAREELIPRPEQHVGNDSYAARSGIRLDDEQVRGVNLVLDRFTKTQPAKAGQPVAFLLGDGTGFGKTIQMLAVADQYKRKGLGQRVLIVTKNKQIAEGRFNADAERMGIDPRSYHITTYTGLDKLSKTGLRDWDLIIYDEAHMLKNADAKKSMAAARLQAKHELFATATPMDKPTGAAYFLAKLTGEDELDVAHKLGYDLVDTTDPVTGEIKQVPRLMPRMDWKKVWQNIMDYRDAAVAAGAMIRREYPFFGNVHVQELRMDQSRGFEQQRLLKHYDNLIERTRNPNIKRIWAGQKTLALSRWAEQEKLQTAVQEALAHVKRGGQAIIVAETDKEQSFREPIKGSVAKPHPEKDMTIHVVPGALDQIEKLLLAAGVKPEQIAHIHNPTKYNIRDAVKNFQAGTSPFALATPASGGTGIDLDDTKGDAPRLMVALSKNMAGDDFEQLVGRVSRKNTASPAIVKFLELRGSYADERRNDILEKKIRTLRAIQGGEELDVARGFEAPEQAARRREGDQMREEAGNAPPEDEQEKRARLNRQAAAQGDLLPPDVKDKGPGMVGMGGAMANEFPGVPTIEDLISGRLAPPRRVPPPQQAPSQAGVISAFGDVLQGILQRGRATLAGLAGHTFPKTTQADRELGELGARWVSSLIAARPMAEVFAADVIGNSGVDPVKFGAALTEDNLRSIKQNFEDKADEAENKDEIIEDLRDQLRELSEGTDEDDPAARAQKWEIIREISRLSKLTPEDAERFREMAGEVQSFVGKRGFPFADEDTYQAFLSDPHVEEVIQRHIANWAAMVEPMYRNAQMIDPDVELPSRGLQTGARINLKAFLGNEGESTRNVVGARRGNLLNTLRRKSPFGVQAKGTGQAYHVDYYDLMENTFGKQLEIANKNAFEKALVEKGQAHVGEPGQNIEIAGQHVGKEAQFPLKRRTLILPGRESVAKNETLYINPRLANEYRIGANVDANPGRFTSFIRPLTRALNFAALASGTDATTHIVNQLSALAALPGTAGRLLQDSLLSALPGRPDALLSIGRALVRGFGDNRAQLASLAEIGALRGPHEVTHIPIMRQVAQAVQWLDRSTRLALDDAYKRLAQDGLVENSETARREFVNQIGQYNKRAQGYMRRWFRDTGLGPFVTAGTTFNTLGIRALRLNPGVKATSMPAALALKANMAAKLAGTVATVALMNYLLTKDKGGGVMGRPGTPIGDIDLGTNDKAGKPNHLAIFSMIGPGRGARVTGLKGFAQSKAMGLPTGVAMDTAERDMINSAMSPWTGPLIKFGVTTATGHPAAVNVGRLSPVVPPGRNQFMANLKTAMIESNPLGAGVNRAMQPGGDWTDVFRGQLPRFLPQTGRPQEMMRDYPGIVRRAQANAYIDDVIGRARKMEPSVRLKYLEDAVSKLEDPRDRQMAIKQFKYRKVM